MAMLLFLRMQAQILDRESCRLDVCGKNTITFSCADKVKPALQMEAQIMDRESCRLQVCRKNTTTFSCTDKAIPALHALNYLEVRVFHLFQHLADHGKHFSFQNLPSVCMQVAEPSFLCTQFEGSSCPPLEPLRSLQGDGACIHQGIVVDGFSDGLGTGWQDGLSSRLLPGTFLHSKAGLGAACTRKILAWQGMVPSPSWYS